MEAIGGYFSLELPFFSEEYHKDAIKLNTGRNCLEYILLSRQYKKVYIPFYICDVVLEPFHKLCVKYEFYHIDISFEILDQITLKTDEALLYVNYFGLKQSYIKYLTQVYGQRLIIDNTQAFYAKHMQGIDTFYTCRKFFGVSDGAYLYTDAKLNEEFEQDKSFNRMTYLLKRIDLSAEDGYKDFRKAEDGLERQPIKIMSNLTERIMKSIDYKQVAQLRRTNYGFLHSILGSINTLSLPLDNNAVPMVYPFLTSKKMIREYLINNKIYVPVLWSNVLEWTSKEKEDIDYLLAKGIIPLPIDQRYGKEEIERITAIIQRYITT